MASPVCASSWLLLLLLLAAAAGAWGWRGEGSHPHLQSLFLGRCVQYLDLLSPEERRDKNCTAIWEAFQVVFYKDPCNVTFSDYDLFALFWENNHLLVTSFAENTRRFTPLCDVLYGRVGDFVSWCGHKNGSGLDYESCPTMQDCEDNPVDSYWKRASMQVTLGAVGLAGLGPMGMGRGLRRHRPAGRYIALEPHFPDRQLKICFFLQYAEDSSGVIYVMLNGSDPAGAYPLKGFFADYEIPYFQKDKITRFEVWVMHEIGGPIVESCGEGSVKTLEDRLKGMGFQYSCINDYL
ncbi:ADP-ribosyl cyclase/cyclic ADP-ribose hydrolase 2 [Galemys pyrenaicus]|uniref:ADP-ribosyl cyclase/cyclic ADP-ribose hydrolase n=1 Tax=Galemys pyrenaicus TaxID=202257 RepID=A0A8J5ZGY7_GALPY|nr:ADP-ribosyl cyclase/cyclic ADP-ribose hydrolase 2 [Galemys pyrenaicus]